MVRVAALALLAGQLQPIAGAVLCGELRMPPGDACDVMTDERPVGPLMVPASEGAGLLCASMGPCAVPGAAVTPAPVDTRITTVVRHVGPLAPAALEPGFEPAPQPPPPQA